MCIAVCGWRCDPGLPFVIIANRDEFHERPAAPLARWEDGSGIIAGRDMRSGGAWVGASERLRRVALVTNFRDPGNHGNAAPSRGALVSDWLTGGWHRVEDRLGELDRFNGFSLMLIDGSEGWIVDNRSLAEPVVMAAGNWYGLANGPFAKPWPKVERLVDDMRGAIDDMRSVIDDGTPEPDAFFAVLAKGGPAAEADADAAPVFIENPVYGTRCSTVVTIGADGRGAIAERRFDAQGETTGTTRIDLAYRG